MMTQKKEMLISHDLIVFSHLRWNFVYQRPQHLISRFAKYRRVFFVEEPVYSESINEIHLQKELSSQGVTVIIPRIPDNEENVNEKLKSLLAELIIDEHIEEFTAWYYTPMALSFTDHLEPSVTIYDCMDELANFKNAPQDLLQYEQELFKKADIVFTGGRSLYHAKKERHASVHAYPSSIETEHFNRARYIDETPADQEKIPSPRLGFFGVIDERMDLHLLEAIAKARPEWNIVLIGPIVKIDPRMIPNLPNIHLLGQKDYQQLPQYLAGWDVALMPFALNESTKFISPTKTPEYLAAGCPVVSTPIPDVVEPYGERELVHIARTPEDFVLACEKAFKQHETAPNWLSMVDEFLADMSWDKTFLQMAKHEHEIRSQQH